MAQTPVESGQTETVGDSGSTPADSPASTASTASPTRRTRPGRVWLAAGVAVMLAAGAAAYLGIHQAQQQNYNESLRPSGIPATISTSLANLMALTPVPATAAPDFTLTDQSGHTLSLSAFHGKAVVLEFMDPHCTDICPIISAEFVDAYRDLGAAAKNVVFLAVNVNPYHTKVTDMAAYSGENGLAAVPTWHFFTGSVPTLKKVWASYNVLVQAPNPNADVVHTSTVYFISPSGKETFEAAPMDDHTKSGTAYLPAHQIADWGTGIALTARHLIG
jgi:cytochrome oxidase Cu insertion factor (SCO1/SenC/PrrC family)